jgi:hypothetical protein
MAPITPASLTTSIPGSGSIIDPTMPIPKDSGSAFQSTAAPSVISGGGTSPTQQIRDALSKMSEATGLDLTGTSFWTDDDSYNGHAIDEDIKVKFEPRGKCFVKAPPGVSKEDFEKYLMGILSTPEQKHVPVITKRGTDTCVNTVAYWAIEAVIITMTIGTGVVACVTWGSWKALRRERREWDAGYRPGESAEAGRLRQQQQQQQQGSLRPQRRWWHLFSRATAQSVEIPLNAIQTLPAGTSLQATVAELQTQVRALQAERNLHGTGSEDVHVTLLANILADNPQLVQQFESQIRDWLSGGSPATAPEESS